MYRGFKIIIILFIFLSEYKSQIIVNGSFGSGTSSWGCSPETNPESVYGGPTANTVAEVDAAAGLCQTITGLTIGGVYRLSYQCSRRVGGCPSPNSTNITITVSGGVLSKADSRTNTTYSLTSSVYIFTATATSHVITFAAGSGFGGSTCGMIMDNLSVVISPLPIELLYFSAEAMDEQSVLTIWETATELNNDFFTIEKSANLLDWQIAGTLKGGGTSLQKLSYNFTDNSPYKGISYYRLKQTDYNGNYKYSSVQSVDLEKGGKISVSPNPSAEHILNINGEEDFRCDINLYNTMGQLIYSSPNHSTNDINLASIEAGVYHLLISKSDKIVYRNRVILQ